MVERTRSAWISGANNRLTKVGVALAHRPAELLGELVEPQVIGATVAAMMKPHPPRGRSHHTTHDPIIEVNGDCPQRSTPSSWCSSVVGAEKPEGGWPEGASGAQPKLRSRS
jgi:hypothetical protein